MRCFLLVVILCMRHFAYAQQATQRVKFESIPLGNAFDHAGQVGKPLFVEVSTEGCNPCVVHENQMFNDPEISGFINEHFTTKWVNADKGEGIEFAKNYKVNHFPTFLVFAPSGELVYRQRGPAGSIPNYLEFVKQGYLASQSKETFSELKKQFLRGEASKEVMARLLSNADLLKYNFESVQDVAAAYYQSLTPEEKSTPKIMLPIAQTLLMINRPSYRQILGMLPALKRAAGDGANELCTTLKLAIVYSIENVSLDDEQFIHLLADMKKINLAFNRTSNEENGLDAIYMRLAYARAGATNVLGNRVDEYVKKYLWMPPEKLKIRDALFWHSQHMHYTPLYIKKANIIDRRNLANRHLEFHTYVTAKNLNNLAWEYFLIQNKETNLEYALKWSSRACELYSHPINLNTKAHILFALGKTKLALVLQQQALDKMRKIGGDTSMMVKALQKMQGTLNEPNSSKSSKWRG